ncbi:MAG: SMI1/KNR4 family protein [Kangiellaceae bacterium]
MNAIQDIIDELRESSNPSSFGLELPSEDDLVLVEEEILLPIPQDVKQFLLEVSDLLIGSLEPVTVADSGSHTHLPEVTANAWEMGLPREYMPICQKGGAFYCVNESGEISFWHDGEFSDEHWEGIWSWAEEVWLHS